MGAPARPSPSLALAPSSLPGSFRVRTSVVARHPPSSYVEGVSHELQDER
jgi:hypothetical protein